MRIITSDILITITLTFFIINIMDSKMNQRDELAILIKLEMNEMVRKIWIMTKR
jgi:hypothetical protein